MEFLKNFNILLNNEYNYLKVKNVNLSKKEKNLEVQILFIISSKFYNKLTVDDYIRILRVSKNLIGQDVDVKIDFEKSDITEVKLIERIKHYISTHEIIVDNPKKLKIEVEKKDEYNYLTNIELPKNIATFFKINNIIDKIKKYLSIYFIEEIEINIIEIENPEIDFNLLTQKSFRYNYMSDTFPIVIREYIAGRAMAIEEAYYVSKFNKAKGPIEKITMAGEISSIKTMISKNKGEYFYKFILSDRKNKINVIYFSKSKKEGPFKDVKEGDILAVFGNIKFDDYSGENLLMATTIAYCDIKNFDKFSDNLEKIHNTLHDSYINVIPEPINDQEEVIATIFDINNNNNYQKQFMNNKFVVFDFETTGLGINTCKVIEIAGIKIVNGKMTETFSTLIYPEMNIPPDVTAINNITDAMVKNKPIIEDVIPDFYKFTKDCILVGHNILDFDIPILHRVAKDAGYIFENKAIDTLNLARKNFKFSNYKLTTIAKEMNIDTANAHRALADVFMNAKIFLYMANNFKIDSLE